MIIGNKYNWKNQPERLIFLGRNWSGNGYWNQFSLVENPSVVWCEILDKDLDRIEETTIKPMKMTLTLTTTVEYEIEEENYEGMTKDEMLACDMDNALNDPYLLIGMEGAKTTIVGFIE